MQRTQSVSTILAKVHSVVIEPGRKGQCPFCKQHTFSIKAKDEVGKCFNARCQKVIVHRGDR